MVDQKALNDKVTDLLVSPLNETNKNRTLHLKERKEYLAALDSMLANHCQNAFLHTVWTQSIWHHASDAIRHDASL
jgi:hypothetical protein